MCNEFYISDDQLVLQDQVAEVGLLLGQREGLRAEDAQHGHTVLWGHALGWPFRERQWLQYGVLSIWEESNVFSFTLYRKEPIFGETRLLLVYCCMPGARHDTEYAVRAPNGQWTNSQWLRLFALSGLQQRVSTDLVFRKLWPFHSVPLVTRNEDKGYPLNIYD